MNAPRTITRRIVLRLDPAASHDGALAGVMRLAKAFRAELAARMISDTRFAGAFALYDISGRGEPSQDIATQLRRAESSLRRTLSAIALDEDASWSFEVVHCAGILAHECGMTQDDLVAIEMPRLAVTIADLRDEVIGTLVHARGVLLLPPTVKNWQGPVVAIVGDRKGAEKLIEECAHIAEALSTPLKRLDHDGQIGPAEQERREAGDIATAVRRFGAALAVIDAQNPIVDEFLARPRFLRELGTPLLLLNTAG